MLVYFNYKTRIVEKKTTPSAYMITAKLKQKTTKLEKKIFNGKEEHPVFFLNQKLLAKGVNV